MVYGQSPLISDSPLNTLKEEDPSVTYARSRDREDSVLNNFQFVSMNLFAFPDG